MQFHRWTRIWSVSMQFHRGFYLIVGEKSDPRSTCILCATCGIQTWRFPYWLQTSDEAIPVPPNSLTLADGGKWTRCSFFGFLNKGTVNGHNEDWQRRGISEQGTVCMHMFVCVCLSVHICFARRSECAVTSQMAMQFPCQLSKMGSQDVIDGAWCFSSMLHWPGVSSSETAQKRGSVWLQHGLKTYWIPKGPLSSVSVAQVNKISRNNYYFFNRNRVSYQLWAQTCY